MIYIGKLYIMEAALQIAKWGNSLAVRLPKAVVEKLGLKEGDDIEIKAAGKGVLEIDRDRTREDALKQLRALRWELPPGFKFNRDEAHERD